MHDNATHNSNAAHDDADIIHEGDVDDVDGDNIQFSAMFSFP